MNDNRPFLPLPAPTEEDHRLQEEWERKQRELEEKEKEDTRVVVIEL